MNRYGRLALDHNQRHLLGRSDDSSTIPDPDAYFTAVGEEIAAEVARRRDEILGVPRADETLEDYRLRSYQALATAEELTLADHPLLQAAPTSEAEDWSDDPDLEHRYQLLATINQAINSPL